MIPILLAFAAGVLLAHVVRLLIGHHAHDLAGRRASVRPRHQDAWLLPDDEAVIRRSRDLSRRLDATDGIQRSTRGEVAPAAQPRRARPSASPRLGFRVTIRVRR